ncbi:MAG TPA: hypothetical protein VFI86_06265 [Burkholderiales bacterium]|nr:hypothetical protein [Burkholderiales bacterium]
MKRKEATMGFIDRFGQHLVFLAALLPTLIVLAAAALSLWAA